MNNQLMLLLALGVGYWLWTQRTAPQPKPLDRYGTPGVDPWADLDGVAMPQPYPDMIDM